MLFRSLSVKAGATSRSLRTFGALNAGEGDDPAVALFVVLGAEDVVGFLLFVILLARADEEGVKVGVIPGDGVLRGLPANRGVRDVDLPKLASAPLEETPVSAIKDLKTAARRTAS